MSTQEATTGKAETGRGNDQTCQKPGCCDSGTVIKITNRSVESAPVLCDTHRKEYLGVSS
jgi:hypothetical protein